MQTVQECVTDSDIVKDLKRFEEVCWDLIKVYKHEDSCCDAEQTTDRIISSFEDEIILYYIKTKSSATSNISSN